MPEGDTIHRTAAVLHRWLAGREVTAARSVRARVATGSLVGDVVERVDARGKHLLVRFRSGRALHTHLAMEGAWHTYRAGERWRRPGHHMRVVLEAGDRVAVCFEAPTVELLAPGEEERHPVLAALGPDVAEPDFDPDRAARRAREASAPGRAVGDVLSDQRIASGIGNVFRVEALFLCGLHPQRPLSTVDDADLAEAFRVASRHLRANLVAGGRDTGLGARNRWVYRRAWERCRRCGAAVAGETLGEQRRFTWWCPTCQPSVSG